MSSIVSLLYGLGKIPLDLGGIDSVVMRPRHAPGLSDEHAAFVNSVRHPNNTRPLREIVASHERVAIIIPDGTRPLPSDRLLPWMFAELAHVPAQNFTIIIGTGSHRANTQEELDQMLGAAIARNYRIINHDAHDPKTLTCVGRSTFGYDVAFNREAVAADRRIIMGFIEPHFMAGFSGGYKAVFPGILGIDTIMHYHGAEVIGDPWSTWGTLENNPTQARIREGGAMLPIDFCINVTLNNERRITRFFCGETMAAHLEGCAYVKASAMTPCEKPFPIVITTNGGFPLDQNLYQSVKGMSAAARIVTPGGLILCAARCNDGFPEHGNFRKLLYEYPSPAALLATINSPGFATFDQWQVQLLAMIQLKARVALYSEMPADQVTRAFMEPVADLQKTLNDEVARLGPDARVAILPEGPLTIPYLTS